MSGTPSTPAEATVTRRVSERVRVLRAQRRWSARELAEACAREGMPLLNRSTIAKIESGARKWVTADEIAVLAQALGVTPETLMSEDTGPAPGWPRENVLASPRPEGQEHDTPFAEADIDLLMRELASLFNTEDRATLLLHSIRFPGQLIPTWPADSTTLEFWRLLFEELRRGIIAAPYRRLLAAAIEIYSSHPGLNRLAGQYASLESPGLMQESPASSLPRDEPAQETTSHLVTWVNADEREAIEAWLAEQGLDPQLEWTTLTSASYRVNQADPHALDRLMRSRPDFPWAVVRSDQPGYVLRFLSVQGPDGRSFRFNDAPSATPVGSVAGDLVDQYTEGLPAAEGLPTIVDHVGPDGLRRMNPDSTLADEGISDGARLRVGIESRAGGGYNPFYPVAPQDWLFADEEDARARTTPPGVQLAERRPHPFLTVVQLSAANASAVLELHLGYYVYYWRAQIRPDDFVRVIQERYGQSDLTLSIAWDSGEVEYLPAEEVIDIAAGKAAYLNPRSALIRFSGQDHSWVWQPGPLDVAGTPSTGQQTAYIVHASMTNHSANFRAANEFLSVSAVDGRHLARSTHLLEGYLSNWIESSATEITSSAARALDP